MKRFSIIAGIVSMAIGMWSCGGKGNNPGRAYMPDMYYSRAYETYNYNDVGGEHDNLRKRGITYNAMPVAGTMARGDIEAYPYPNNDSGYAQSAAYKSPFDTAALSPEVMKEAERLYLVNCAICHGAKLDGNGPLWNDGNGPFPAAPRNLLDDYTKKLADGTIYHVIEYGKGQMGSYASQLHPQQRWWVIKYIRSKEGGGAPAAAAATDSTAASTTSPNPTTK
jgi:mono/diheme cytochrome c family protein